MDEDEKRRELAKLDALAERERTRGRGSRPVDPNWADPRPCVECGETFWPRRPLEIACDGADEDGVPCKVRSRNRRERVYRADAGAPRAADMADRDAAGRFKRRDG